MNWEIAVIGSGPGGAVTAYHLAKAGKKVLLIEEGTDLPTPSFSLKELREKYRARGQTVAFGSPKIQYVEGCCLGGGSEINSGLYHRLPDEVREEWRERLQIERFKAADLESHYQACEQMLSVQTLKTAIPLSSLKLAEGALKLGWKAVEVPRWFGPDNTRFSMSKTFLPGCVEAGGEILLRTKIARLKKEGRKWRLIGPSADVIAETVFICGGAIQTPALLQRSGIRENIGNHLALHPTVKWTAHFEEEVNGEGVPVHQVKEFAPRISLGGSVSKLPHLMAMHANHPLFPGWFASRWKHLFIYYAMIQSQTRGRVRVIPACDAPFVSYKMDKQDRNLLAEAQKKLAELLFAAGAKELIPSEGLPLSNLSSMPDRIDRQAKGIMTIHLCGSCPMGENRALCATDSFGKVHGFDNLYVADASLLGGSPSVNPQGSIMAIARRNALHFLGKL